jgi:hypothetical protein
MRVQNQTTFSGSLWSNEGAVLAQAIHGIFEPPAAGELCWRGHFSADSTLTDRIRDSDGLIVRRHGCGGTPIRIHAVQTRTVDFRFWCEHPIEPGPVTLDR